MITRLFIKFMTILGVDENMIVLLFVQRVILGKTAFADVPRQLKQAVYEDLVDSGFGELAGDYQPPEAP